MGNLIYTTLFETALAEAEADAGEIETALASIDHAVDLTERTGQRWNEADIHRARGDILLKRDPANTVPAEKAFLTAIAVARQQKARSLELRAALSLAKLYQSTERPADAHAVLGPALEGFSPTPELPEIEETRALLAALAATDEVRSAAASHERRLKLQTDYGQALLWARGFSSEEAKVALDRAQELTVGTDGAPARFSAYYGKWLSCSARGEMGLAGRLRRRSSAKQRSPAARSKRLWPAATSVLAAFGKPTSSKHKPISKRRCDCVTLSGIPKLMSASVKTQSRWPKHPLP
jgi:hypothetical protein